MANKKTVKKLAARARKAAAVAPFAVGDQVRVQSGEWGGQVGPVAGAGKASDGAPVVAVRVGGPRGPVVAFSAGNLARA